jgi:hypothetical protein
MILLARRGSPASALRRTRKLLDLAYAYLKIHYAEAAILVSHNTSEDECAE